jgi:hypothetical protein
MIPSQMWLADMHLLSPQCKEDLVERVPLIEGPLIILPNVVVADIAEVDIEEAERELHSPHPTSSL